MVKQVHTPNTAEKAGKQPALVEKTGRIAELDEVSQEVRNRLDQGLSVGAVSAIFKALLPAEVYSPFFEAENLAKLDETKLLNIWNKVVSAPWVQNHIETLKAEILRRIDEKPKASIPDLIANLEVNTALKPGFIVAFDLNGYSQFLKQATNKQKADLDERLQKTMFALCAKHGVTLLQAPAGDCYIFHSPYQDKASKKAFEAFLKEMTDLEVPSGLANPDPKKFPKGNFRASIGWSFSASGETNTKLYTGSAGNDQGITHVNGKPFINALNAQDKAADGEIKTDMAADFDYEEHTSKVVHLHGAKKIEMPKDKKVAVAVLAALVTATHPRGSLSQFNRRRESETTLPEFGVTSIAVNIGDGKNRTDLRDNPEKYDAVLRGLLKLQEKYPEVRVFKIDVNVLHLTSKADLHKGGATKVLQFAKELGELIESVKLEYGIGIEYNPSLVRINVQDSTIEERSGNGISVATKMAKEKVEQPIRVGRDFASAAWGNIHELTLYENTAKGVVMQMLPLELAQVDDLHKIHGKELIGAEEDLAQITHFVESIGNNGSLLQISGEMPGAGVSARIRHAMREADRLGLKRVNIGREGNDQYALIRGFLKAVYPDFRPTSDEELFIKAEDALSDDAWKKRSLVVCDLKNLSAAETSFLTNLSRSIVGHESGFVYSGDLPLKERHETIEVKALSPENAAELIFKNRGDLKDLRVAIFDQVVTDLRRISESGGPALIPSNVVHIYSKSLRAETAGTTARFELGKMDVIRTGEFALRIESESPERQFLIGLLAYMKSAFTAENIWAVYQKLRPEVKKEVFDEDLTYLLEKGFLMEEKGNYSLKNLNYASTAEELLTSNISPADASREILSLEFADHIEAEEAKLAHMIEAKADLEEIRKSTSKLVKHYLRVGSLNAARETGMKFFTYTNFDIKDINPSTADFYMDLAWSFIQSSGSNEQQISAGLIYEYILKLDIDKEQREQALWGLYRMYAANSTIDTQKDAAEIVEENDLAKIGESRTSLQIREIQKRSNDEQIKYCLRIADIFHEVKVLAKVAQLGKSKVSGIKEKAREILEELNKAVAEKPELSFKNKLYAEVEATTLRLTASAYSEIGQKEKAIEAFKQAETAYRELPKFNAADYIQTNSCIQGNVNAQIIVLSREASKISTADERDAFLKKLDLLEAKINSAIETMLSQGDIKNRAFLTVDLINIVELRFIAMSKFPDPTTNKVTLATEKARAEKNASTYINILKQVGNKVRTKEELLHDLNQAWEALPEAA